MPHPFRIRLSNMYYRLSHRNFIRPSDGKHHVYGPEDTLFKKIKALWKGMPEEKPLPPLLSVPQ